MAERERIVVLGAAGRDFHDFQVLYRDDPTVRVLAFTAAQIPGISGRRFPASLSGAHHPDGIPIVPEEDLEDLLRRERVGAVAFAYSDVSHGHVLGLAERSLAAGCDFRLHAPDHTWVPARIPVLAVCAVRTGCGKSQIARWLGQRLRARGLRAAAMRHPMPYGDLERQRVQRFASRADLDAASCTAEEREEYEPHLEAGNVVFAGVDTAALVALAETEADVVVWDGGNNDFPLVRPNLLVCVADALRPGQATGWHPGEAVLRRADVIVVNKVDAAPPGQADAVVAEVRAVNPRAPVVRAASPVRLEDEAAVRGRRVLVVEDGPTLTHGGMAFGAGTVAARAAGAAEIVDPRPFAAPALRAVYARYPHIGPVLPAVGYGPAQLEALGATLDAAPADVIVAATPVDLRALVAPALPVVRARYAFAEAGEPGLGDVVDAFVSRIRPRV